MASKYRQKQAKIALSKLDGGRRSPITDPVAESARKLLTKGWTEADLKRVEDFNGVRGKSTATAIQRSQRAFARQAQNAQNYLNSASQLASPSTSAYGRANITLQITKDIEAALKTPLVKTLTAGVGKYLGENPSAARIFLRSLGSGLRVGGAVATVALLGVEAAESYYTSAKNTARAQIASLDLRRKLGINSRQSKGNDDAIAASTRAGADTLDRILDDLGLSSSVNEETERRKREAYQQKAAARGHYAELGIDSDKALAAGAQQLGKSVGQLTGEERQDILDQAYSQRFELSSRKFKRKGRGIEDPDETVTVISGAILNDPRIVSKLKKLGYYVKDLDDAANYLKHGGDRFFKAAYIEAARQVAKVDAQAKLEEQGKRQENAERARLSASPLDLWKANEALQKEAAEFASFRLRQRPYLTN